MYAILPHFYFIVLYIYCPYYSISRTILPRTLTEHLSAFQLWSKTGKNGRTYGVTSVVDLQIIFFVPAQKVGSLLFCTPLVKSLLEGKTMIFC